jgi:peroxiredoxin
MAGTNGLPRPIHDLEQEFAGLAAKIPESPEKRAISILHGIVMELWRRTAGEHDAGDGVPDVAEPYRTAPPDGGRGDQRAAATGRARAEVRAARSVGRRDAAERLPRPAARLVSYPLDRSPGCSQQLDLYQQELDEFRGRGVELVANSVDSLYSHGACAAVRGLTFPLLADFDPKGAVAREYSVWRQPDGFSERALYVMDPDGTIAFGHVSPFVHHVPDIDELFQVLDELVGGAGVAMSVSSASRRPHSTTDVPLTVYRRRWAASAR